MNPLAAWWRRRLALPERPPPPVEWPGLGRDGPVNPADDPCGRPPQKGPTMTDPDPATTAAVTAAADYMRKRAVRGQSWEDLAAGALTAAMRHLVPGELQARTLIAAGRMLERDDIIKLAVEVGAVYPNPGADRGPLREVLQRAPTLPFADLLGGDTGPGTQPDRTNPQP